MKPVQAVLLAPALALALASCASEPQGIGLPERLAGLIGKPTSAATALFGNPGIMRPQGPLTLYIWTAKQNAAAPEPGPHNAANEKGARTAALIRENPNAVQPPPSCTLQLAVDGSGRIKSYRLSGDASRCDQFARAFLPRNR